MRHWLLGVYIAWAGLSLWAQSKPPDSPGVGTGMVAGSASGDATETSAPVAEEPATMFPHSASSPFRISGQANIIFQAHPPFHALYSGANSLSNAGEYKTSLVGTLYLGVEVPHTGKNTEFLLDIESAGGRGISQALGLAGFTNLDVVRNPNLGPTPYVARAEIHQIIPLSGERAEAERGPLNLATSVPVRRLDIRVGKMGAPDSFDINSVGSDSHLQFTNWAIDNNGAYDYAADTRGYTYGAVIEYQDRIWAARYGVMLMSTVANGPDLDWALRRAHGDNIEFDLRKGIWWKKPGAVRFLSYVNHARMGNYREANTEYVDGLVTPDIIATRTAGAVKYGFGLNMEQQLTEDVRAFARFGWNNGKTESYEYTEVDETVEGGGDYSGRRWGRAQDKLGVAFVSNAIKKDHQFYLQHGGRGFLLGDGTLNYGRENILESYYNLHTWRGVFYALGASYIRNPGYNRDRGPVIVPSVRMHVEF